MMNRSFCRERVTAKVLRDRVWVKEVPEVVQKTPCDVKHSFSQLVHTYF